VIVDDRRPFLTEDIQRKYSIGVPKIDADIGEVLTSRLPGRKGEHERILILNLGNAACDVVVATEIYQRATTMGLGVALEM
jgi:ornithine cyclodeaminase/alanine dehydrogenase-like protein (mu-crystallin family)